MTPFLIFFGFFLGGVLGYILGGFKESEELIDSELSDPTVNIPPYGFYASHFRLLERIAYFSGFGTPEFDCHQVDEWEKSNDKRAGELAKMGFLKVRSIETAKGKKNFYSINQRGRQAVLNFNSRY